MSKFCTNCGKELNDNAIACDGCGNKIEVTENNSMQKKEKKYGYYLLRTLLFAVIWFFGAWFLNLILGLILHFANIDIKAGNFLNFMRIVIPIYVIVFSPVIAAIVYSIKKKN